MNRAQFTAMVDAAAQQSLRGNSSVAKMFVDSAAEKARDWFSRTGLDPESPAWDGLQSILDGDWHDEDIQAIAEELPE